MRSLTSLHESRVYSPENFWSPVQKDFCNNICHKPTYAVQRVYWPNCTKPQIASSAATAKPTHETDMDTESGPICTAHRLIILTMWASATIAKISAVTAA